MHPVPSDMADPDETAELPALDPEVQRGAEAGALSAAAPVAAERAAAASEATAREAAAREAAVQEAARLAVEQEQAARAAEIGSLRTSLASATETRGQLEGSLQKLTANLRDLEERLHRKSDQLSIFEREVGARDRHIAELEADIRARSAAAQTLQERHDALAVELQRTAQNVLSAEEARRSSEEQHSALRLAHALSEARIARAESDLGEQQRRSERYREQLQALEGRRQVFDGMLHEREQLLAERDARVLLLETEIAERTQHAGARESDLIATLGSEKQRAQALEHELDIAREDVVALTRRAEQVRSDADTRVVAAERRARELEQSSEQRVGEIERDWAERLQETERAAAQRIEELERTVAAAADAALARESDLQARLASAESRAQDQAGRLESLGVELAGLAREQAGAQERIAAQDNELGEYAEMVRALHDQLAAAGGRAETLGADLLAAEDRIRTLEAELRAREATIERQERAGNEARARIDEIGRSLDERNALISRLETEAASSVAVLGSIQQNLERLGQNDAAPSERSATPAVAAEVPPPAAESAAARPAAQLPFDQLVRLLVRTEGDTGIVQVLGRRTSIGRTADNDMRIDADYISRHHAVILATTTGTVIEDLHSTNGVQVNGVRVTRQRLNEGDLVVIGRTEFRYVTKPAGERPGH
ncbi:MAG: FHA domain-containing protein [Gammaproteobacteria bacterium]|nr:FHA domain-containing protein [Gammaproteobacteria bacterium]